MTPGGVTPAVSKTITVSLPKGVQVNPSVANGLAACSEAEIGLASAAEPSCPAASKVATAEVVTPLLDHPLAGSLYAAAQTANPFGTLLAVYLVVKDPISGVLVKLAGKVTAAEGTGRLTATFDDVPEFPVEDARVNFFDSPRSALSTPSQCGPAETEGVFSPSSGEPASVVSSSFEILTGVGGGACGEPFAPGFQAGTSEIQAGGFAPVVTNITRRDGDQALGKVSETLPAGVGADLTGVPLCPEAEANAGSCPAASKVGEVSVQAGLGDEPVTVQGGQAYLTGPYQGAPFGLSIVTDAKAGPFDLGTVVVRAKVSIDPSTAQVTVSTNELPTMLQGIPLQIKAVHVTANRAGFSYDPTSCLQKTVTGTITSAQNVSVPVSSAFRAANCATLGFKPRLSASTTSKYSKKLGADLTVKVAFPKAPFGSQANIARVKVDLPVQLPSRQSTFKYACPAATFAANPANCPVHSIIGKAKATTPIIPVPLQGNAYLVSHAGESIPNVVMVFQGYGITVNLAGTTHITKGVTSNTFAAVPDAPVSSFEVTFPQSEYSLLAGYKNFCKTKLSMPVSYVSQAGQEQHETVKVAVTGCTKHKPKAKPKAKKKATKATTRKAGR